MGAQDLPQAYVRRLPENVRGRDLVIGDIHGHFGRVQNELERVGFDPALDRLICCGDLIDRGPASAEAADWLERPWFYSVMGNHDASLLNRCGLLSAKFELWHDFHGWFDALERAARQRLVALLAALPWLLEVESEAGLIGVVHAEVPQRYAHWRDFCAAIDDEEVRSLATSSRVLARQAGDLGLPGLETEHRLAGVAWAIHGHTPRPGCRPGQLGNRLWIDTAGWYHEPRERGVAGFTLIDIRNPLKPL